MNDKYPKYYIRNRNGNNIKFSQIYKIDIHNCVYYSVLLPNIKNSKLKFFPSSWHEKEMIKSPQFELLPLDELALMI